MRSFPFALALVCGATRLEEIENDTSGEAGPMTCCLMDPVLELESLSVSAIDPQHGDVTQCRVTTALVCGSHEECEEKCKNDIKANLLTLKLLTPLRREEQGEAGQALTAAKAALRQAQQALDLAQANFNAAKAKKDEADAKYSNCTSRVKEAARRESKAEKRSVSPVGICGGGDCCCSFVEGSVATPLLVSASTFGSWGKCKLIRPYARSGFSFCRTYNTECPNCRKLVCANNGAGSC
eukprot:CAMPEP_0181458992 /NCGR_PEP_ID=MMETSP1110-20121109/32596_1 /TAXON_ID=174948 /ORGANISM="Symbiodinium sp., Strain CCMP421" /LENGTH=238 /DNA_ID=CAMNT_0023583499 /DNA_START=65 /DNA_END=778 /DNA_ORIENTATION=+